MFIFLNNSNFSHSLTILSETFLILHNNKNNHCFCGVIFCVGFGSDNSRMLALGTLVNSVCLSSLFVSRSSALLQLLLLMPSTSSEKTMP